MFRNLKRLYEWYKNVLKDDVDFDAHSLYGIIEYKLKRTQKRLLDNNYVEFSKQELQGLKLAIKLAGRLDQFDYGERGNRKHNAKWGELEIWFTPLPNGNFSFHGMRPNAIFEKDKKQETKEFREIFQLEDKLHKREQKWLFGILQKYLNRWWD